MPKKRGISGEFRLHRLAKPRELPGYAIHEVAVVIEKRAVGWLARLVVRLDGTTDLFNSKEPNTSHLCCGQPRDDVLALPHGGACAASFIVLESYPNIHSMNTVDHLHRFGMEAGETSVKMREPGGIPHHRR